MPTINWIGKDKIVNHHLDIPYHTLDLQYTFDAANSPSGAGGGNKIIHADNLLALKSLLPEYEGRIKCIYIDPPYNTGNEGWVYNDNVSDPKLKKWLGQVVGKEAEDLTRHDKWLCMMYPRLKLLHKLLAEDGAIFISIDDNEQANLKMICDEIFGGGNFLTQFTWRKTDNQANIGMIANVKEYILCYSKNKNNVTIGKISLTEKAKNEYRYKDDIGFFRRKNILDKSRGKKYFDIQSPNGEILKGPWMLEKADFDRLNLENKIYWANEKMPYGKKYLHESEGQIPNDNLGIEVGSNQQAAVKITELFGKRIFDFPKPDSLIAYFLSFSSAKDSIILDSFAGSGTTAHAVLNLNKQDGGNRKFILIELEDYAETITAERVKRVMQGYGNTEGTGGSFSYYTMGESLFDTDGNLNESLSIEKIRRYIYYTETKQWLSESELSESNLKEKDNAAFLAKYNDTAYYFNYEVDRATTLNHDFLSTIKTKAEQYIIYADKCLLTKEFMSKHAIIFKKIPRDITKF